MDENKIRMIVQQEINKSQAQSVFNMQNTQSHIHSGTSGDAPKIPAANIIPGLRASGLITMSTNNRVYRLGLNFNATQIQVYGTATHSTSSPGVAPFDVRAHVAGNAQLGGTYRFIDDGTGNSVTAGGTTQTLIQGSSSITVAGQTTPTQTRVITSEENIAYVVDGSGSQAAVATVIGYGPGFVDIRALLNTNWNFELYFVVT